MQHHDKQLANRKPPQFDEPNAGKDGEVAMKLAIPSAIATFIMMAYSRCSELKHVDYAMLPELISSAVVATAVTGGIYLFRHLRRVDNSVKWNAHHEWKKAMEKEASTVQSIEMPAACRPPALDGVAKP